MTALPMLSARAAQAVQNAILAGRRSRPGDAVKSSTMKLKRHRTARQIETAAPWGRRTTLGLT
ncbi:hypothetical protein CH340_05160 [Rhodoplanes serenus]|nr:hypothetical protein CH340_05160 [Rhodoplanes serenus]